MWKSLLAIVFVSNFVSLNSPASLDQPFTVVPAHSDSMASAVVITASEMDGFERKSQLIEWAERLGEDFDVNISINDRLSVTGPLGDYLHQITNEQMFSIESALVDVGHKKLIGSKQGISVFQFCEIGSTKNACKNTADLSVSYLPKNKLKKVWVDHGIINFHSLKRNSGESIVIPDNPVLAPRQLADSILNDQIFKVLLHNRTQERRNQLPFPDWFLKIGGGSTAGID